MVGIDYQSVAYGVLFHVDMHSSCATGAHSADVLLDCYHVTCAALPP